ncbi:rop guanine nucleotide exchange factor 1-like protein [Trifolium pratense]|uniref:Rop guanine nucleotide exchange factor 1-like protein n=1 Tax=Trifolium pratense TaxID=57577 RepID=A0A2K3MCS0_TRIPR|nr:rop guanine nucleotide exchange factor 1-like protein [Trifolium pratense]
MVINTNTNTNTNTPVIYVPSCSTMEDLSLSLAEKNQVVEENVGCDNGVAKRGIFSDLIEEKGCCESSSSSEFLSSENIGNEEQHSHSSTEEGSSSPLSLVWNVQKISASDCSSPSPHGSEDVKKKHLVEKEFVKQVSALTEIEMMKERFAKLLLGEDMSGCGNGDELGLTHGHRDEPCVRVSGLIAVVV